jgi:hypothetical protein
MFKDFRNMGWVSGLIFFVSIDLKHTTVRGGGRFVELISEILA